MKRSAVLILAGALLLAFAGTAPAAVTLYVDNHTYQFLTTWPGHYHTIGEALAVAQYRDTIWVARGTYDENLVMDSLHGNGVDLRGGFRGSGTSERNPQAYPTIITGGGRPQSVIRMDGCTDPNTCVDGFTIRDGVGTLDSNSCFVGGGLYITNSNPVISYNTFLQNGLLAGPGKNAGGAIYCVDSAGRIRFNQFLENAATPPALGYAHGGAIVLLRSSPSIMSNIFKNNRAGETGGAIMAHYSCNPIISNNLFTGNSSSGKGAAVAAHQVSSPKIINNTFHGNISGTALTLVLPGLQGGVIDLSEQSTATLANNIIAFNQATAISKEADIYLPPLSCNDFFANMGTWQYPLLGNLAADPLFANAASGNFRLKHSPLSPCLDAGDNNYAWVGSPAGDLTGAPRIWDYVVDIGCYESGSIPPSTTCSLSGTLGLNGWYRSSPITVTLSAMDGSMPLAGQTKYALAGTTLFWGQYYTPFPYMRPGANNLFYYSTDLDGNVEAVKSTLVKLDATVPSLTVTAPAGTIETTTPLLQVTGSSFDLHSGVLSVRWLNSAMGSGLCTGTLNWTATVPLFLGAQQVVIKAMDQAGNTAMWSRLVTLKEADTTPPTLPAPPASGPYTAAIRLVFSEPILQGDLSPWNAISVVDPKAKKPANLVTAKQISGSELLLTASLSAGRTYLVSLPNRCVVDMRSNPFAGASFNYLATRK